jgi:hypothetical protein
MGSLRRAPVERHAPTAVDEGGGYELGRGRSGNCTRSRQVIAPLPLDANLRWTYLYLMKEYSRHLGHADLLRERIDGATGE